MSPQSVLLVSWPTLGKQVRSEVLAGVNEALLREIEHALPLEGLSSHSVTSGLDLTIWTPVYASVPLSLLERIDEMPIGRVFASRSGGKILIKYGPQTEWVALPPIAQVVGSDLATLTEVGRRVWESIFFTKELIPMRVEMGRGTA